MIFGKAATKNLVRKSFDCPLTLSKLRGKKIKLLGLTIEGLSIVNTKRKMRFSDFPLYLESKRH